MNQNLWKWKWPITIQDRGMFRSKLANSNNSSTSFWCSIWITRTRSMMAISIWMTRVSMRVKCIGWWIFVTFYNYPVHFYLFATFLEKNLLLTLKICTACHSSKLQNNSLSPSLCLWWQCLIQKSTLKSRDRLEKPGSKMWWKMSILRILRILRSLDTPKMRRLKSKMWWIWWKRKIQHVNSKVAKSKACIQ